MPVTIGTVTTFPHPKANKAQVVKIAEEEHEIFSAWEKFHKCTDDSNECGHCRFVNNFAFTCPRYDLINECADAIEAICNLLAAIGVDDMRDAMRACEARNRERGRL